jgi:hypothetical protein
MTQAQIVPQTMTTPMAFFNKSCIPMAIVIPSRESHLHGVTFSMVTFVERPVLHKFALDHSSITR